MRPTPNTFALRDVIDPEETLRDLEACGYFVEAYVYDPTTKVMVVTTPLALIAHSLLS